MFTLLLNLCGAAKNFISRARTRPTILLIAVLMTGCNQVSSTAVIGVGQPLSGGLASLGLDMVRGVELAIEDINKAGLFVDGKQVTLQLVQADDKGNAEDGKVAAQALIDAGAVAVVAHLNSGVSIATAPMYAAQDISQLAISTNPKYTQLGLPTTFRLVANDDAQSKTLAKFAADKFAQGKFAIVDEGTPYGKGLADSTVALLKKTQRAVVLTQSLNDKMTDFTALIPKLKDSGANVLVSTLNDFQVIALIDQMNKANLSMAIIGGDTLKTSAMLKAASTSSSTLYATSPLLDAKEFPKGKEFTERFKAKYKDEPVYGAHYAYDAVYAITRAMRMSKSTKAAEITKSMRIPDAYVPLTQFMRFDKSGEQEYSSVGVFSVHKGAWELELRSSELK